MCIGCLTARHRAAGSGQQHPSMKDAGFLDWHISLYSVLGTGTLALLFWAFWLLFGTICGVACMVFGRGWGVGGWGVGGRLESSLNGTS